MDSARIPSENGCHPTTPNTEGEFRHLVRARDDLCRQRQRRAAASTFEKLSQGETWVTREALTQIGVAPIRFPLMPRPAKIGVPLHQSNHTDVLVLGIQSWPAGIIYSPVDVNGRAALYSLGFMMRRAAAVQLDIDERELKVGLRVIRMPTAKFAAKSSSPIVWRMEPDTASHLGTPTEAENLLRLLVGPGHHELLCAACGANLMQMLAKHRALIACAILAISRSITFWTGGLD